MLNITINSHLTWANQLKLIDTYFLENYCSMKINIYSYSMLTHSNVIKVLS